MIKTIVRQLSAYGALYKPYILFFLGAGIIVSILIKLNVHVWGRLTTGHLTALIGPYLFSFAAFSFMIRICWRRSLVIWIGAVLLAVLWLIYAADFWFEYAYHWLPARGINFVGKITPNRLIQFNNRVFVGNMLVLLMAGIVQLLIHYFSFRARFRRRSKTLDTEQVSARLSSHFTKQWIKIVQDNKMLHRPDTLHLLQYIIDVVANKKLKVAIAEEWAQLKVMASCFTERTVEFDGEQLLTRSDWNRSLPAATLLSWFENALDHSPKGQNDRISILWQRVEGKLRLQMSNTIAVVASDGHSGSGTRMVQQLFDQLLPGNYNIEYTNHADTFTVQLSFM
ncbi:MAG: hypothetical protein ACN6ON_01360 [Sphingobacterium sp.]